MNDGSSVNQPLQDVVLQEEDAQSKSMAAVDDAKEASPGGFMRTEDEDLEKQRQLSNGQELKVKAEDEKDVMLPDAQKLSTSAKEGSSDDENSISVTNSSTSSSSTTSSGKAANLTVSTNINGMRNSSSPSNAGRMMPARKSSPPPTPPARTSSSEGRAGSYIASSSMNTRIPKRKSSSPASASSSRLQAVTSSSSSSPPGSASMKRTSSPLMSEISRNNSNSASPPPLKKQAISQGSSSPPTLRVKDENSIQAKSRSPSPGSALAQQSRPLRSSSPKSDDSSPPSSPPIGPQPDTSANSQHYSQSNGSSSPPPSSDDSSSSPVKQAPQSPRRVKIYALFDSNWIDLGTGSCTYHEGTAHRKRRKIEKPPSSTPKEPPPSPPVTKKGGVSIAGRAARDAKKREEDEAEYVDEIQLIDINDEPPAEGQGNSDWLESDGEYAAWIEIEKEGRWKSDAPAPKKAKKKGKRSTEETEGEAESPNVEVAKEQEDNATASKGEADGADDEDDDMEEDGGPEYDRIWQSRIERPTRDALGLIDYDSFSPHPGAEGENEEVIGRYRRQQETLIVWKSSSIPLSFSTVVDTEVDEQEFALSFAATSGCAEVWEFLKSVHLKWQSTYETMQDIEDDVDLDTLGVDTYGSSATSKNAQGASTYSSTEGAFGNGGHFGLGLGAMTNASGPLPAPELSNLEECEARIKFGSRTAVGREKLAAGIMKTGFIKKMFSSFTEAEDLESLHDLHLLCSLLHDIFNLNDQQLWEYLLSDDIFFDAVSILEYDPDFPTMKASYRTHLSDPSLFVEVVPINNAGIEEKIHQIYRLQYLKDIILPRVLDDSAFTIINSFIHFHQVDIVQYLHGNERFWKDLFALFPGVEGPSVGPRTSAKDDEQEKKKKAAKKETNGAVSDAGSEMISKQIDAVAFLQSYAQMVKQLQPGMRTSSFKKLSEVGLLPILAYCLTSPKMQELQSIRVATVEILMLMVDHDTSSIRSFVLQQHAQGKKRTLMMALVQAFESEQELGIKAQLAEAVRVLVLPPGDVSATETAAARIRPDDPNADKFLQYFYDHCVQELFKPLNKGLESPAFENAELDLSPVQIAGYTHLCDLLCFFVSQHVFRSKIFITSSPVCEKVALLLRAKPKHVRLAALRYFRACLGRNDAFYFRSLIKNNVFPPILSLTTAELKANNLLSSACLELFEFLRTTNVKPILNHLMETLGDELRSLASEFPNFKMLVARWEQNNEPLPAAQEDPPSSSDTAAQPEPSSSAIEDMLPTTTKADERSLTSEEEKYFDAEDDDEEDEPPKASTLKRSEPSTLLSRFTHGKDEQEADSDILRRKRQKMEDSSATPTGTMEPVIPKIEEAPRPGDPSSKEESVTAPADADTDPEQELARIREKRKRAEEEEESEDMLAKKKTTTAMDKEKGKKTGVSGAAAGKLKLLFGKKSS